MKSKIFTHRFLYFFLLFITILFIAKAFISSAISLQDEMHYIATSLRFYDGDAFLVDDWSPEQLNGFLLLPFVALYKIIFRTTSGIVLYFRLLHIFIKLLITLYSFYRLSRKKMLNIFTASCGLIYYCFTPYNIDALSYNTIPLSMIYIIFIILLTDSFSKKDYFICGILMAIATLSQPFLSILYFMCIPACIIYSIYSSHENNPVPILYIKNFILFTLGICALAFVFLIFIFSRSTLLELVQNIPFIFAEPDHNIASVNTIAVLGEKLSNIFSSFWSFNHGLIAGINLLCIVAIFLGNILRKKYIPFIISILSLLISCLTNLIFQSDFSMNVIYIPFVWFCIEQFLLVSQQRIKYFFILSICTIYTICTALGTNTGILSTSASMCIFSIFSLILLSDNVFSLHSTPTTIRFGYATALFSFFVTFLLHLLIVWTDFYNPTDYTCLLKKGPLKWTFAREDLYIQYTNIINVLDIIDYTENDILFCGTSTPTAYLYADVEFGTMGTPFFYLDYARLSNYLALHPEKVPTVIYYEELSGTNEEKIFLDHIMQNYNILSTPKGFLAVKLSSNRNIVTFY